MNGDHALALEIGELLSAHKPHVGMVVAMGTTCACGYWSGAERPGISRPAGYQGLEWHRALVLEEFMYSKGLDNGK